jgi:hypothetical protein
MVFDSASKSNQYAVSSASRTTILMVEMKCFLDEARNASR